MPEILYILRTARSPLHLYVPAGIPEPNAVAQERLRSILITNSNVDAVGGNMIHGDMLMPDATILSSVIGCLLHLSTPAQRAFNAVRHDVQCLYDPRWHAEMLKHAAVSMGELAPLSVFIGLQERGD